MYIKDGIKTSMPMFPNVINPSQEFILANGWQLFEESEQPYKPTHTIRITSPKSLAFDRIELLLYKMRFELMGLPVEDDGSNLILWCDKIIESDIPVLQSLTTIKVEVWDDNIKEFVRYIY